MAVGDVTKSGFGATVPSLITGSTASVVAQSIASAPGKIIRIRKIRPFARQVSGAIIASSAVAVAVVRGSPNMSAVPLRFINSPSVGVPGVTELAGLTLLFQGEFRLQAPEMFEFDENVLIAQNGDVLCVVVSPLIDLTTNPPTVNDLGVIGVTTLGDDLQVNLAGPGASTIPIGTTGQGIGASMPRWGN